MPVMRMHEAKRRMIIASGSDLTTYTFAGNKALPVEEARSRSVIMRDRYGRTCYEQLGRHRHDIITAMACEDDTGDVIVGHVTGLLQKCRITSDKGKRPEMRSISRYTHSPHAIQALDISKSGLMACVTADKGGTVSLYKLASPWLEPYTWKLRNKPWSMMLDPSGKSPRWLAVGQSGHSPLLVYELGEDGLPTSTEDPIHLLGNEWSTAVYGFTSPPPTSPIGNAAHIIVSAWYDGYARLHDLRRPSRQPVLTLEDPFADVPLYSVACGGGAGCTVAAGTARHGLVRLWDIRSAKDDIKSGSSLFGPGKDNSPVYGLHMEHDRLFGVTDKRAWMLEFGQPTPSIWKQPVDRGYSYRNGRQCGRSQQQESTASDVYYYRHAEMRLAKVG